MSLKWYRRPRLIALGPETSVLEAARAIENNEIGAVIVQQKGRVVGIVTDRDLATRVLGRKLDPETTPLREIMSSPVWTLSLRQNQSDAVELMRSRNVRRIPLLDQERLAGLVTLDDLLLDELVPIGDLAAVIEAQIGEGGPAPSERKPGVERRMGRAESTYGRLLNRLRSEARLKSSSEAEVLLDSVLESVLQRLTPDEAKDTIAQLPSLMHPDLRQLPPGPDKRITRQSIEERIARALGVPREQAADLLEVAGAVISQVISGGQMENIRGQLPPDLRSIFTEPRATAA